MAFFTLVFGDIDKNYDQHFLVQLLNLPVRLLLVYGTTLYLISRYLEQEKYMGFAVGIFGLFLFCGFIIQRGLNFYFLEWLYFSRKDMDYSLINALITTSIDVGVAAVLPLGYYFFKLWRGYHQALSELSQKMDTLVAEEEKFIFVKEGNTNTLSKIPCRSPP